MSAEIPAGKRRREAQEDAVPKNRNKRHKKNPADDLICPITRELPWSPVIALDGRTYEEVAIKKYFNRQRESGASIKSPITNELMGETLIPTPHIRSLIETLVENGTIQGDVLVAWNIKVKQMKKKNKLLQKANEGNVRAMLCLACFYPVNAYNWNRKAHDAGSVLGTARVGETLLKGIGVTKSLPLGIMYLTQAATAGSDLAAYCLGKFCAAGQYGMPVSEKEAIVWLQKSLGACTHKNLNDEGKVIAQVLLDNLLKKPNSAAGDRITLSDSYSSD
ncbi:Sel1 domain protein repeat-containing protein [Seminavis robusta]|uniref:Sel1 domain protein repeat-containing protein n=1 Tax=Seminavis robusta TaxID=568900 RepID=A0A9N8EF23_9STRA|nr:Sel1 domain protein repeat-containing protein [Seminavis robusta]|eukprot:Sro983_g227810.1 Sel1 domain protein repeat-containing protein (277) ;mRNA; f:23652-24482